MAQSNTSTATLLAELTQPNRSAQEVITKAQQLLEMHTLDPVTEASVALVLQMAQGRALEMQLMKADEKDKDILIYQIIDKYPPGVTRDSFIRLLLDRMVVAGQTKKIAELANQVSAVPLKNKYLEEAALCLFRQVMLARDKDSVIESQSNESYAVLANFLMACYRLSANNEISKTTFIRTAEQLVEQIDALHSYAMFDEMIKLVVKLEGVHAFFCKETLEKIISHAHGIAQAIHTWVPFNSWVTKEKWPAFRPFLNTLTAENAVLDEILMTGPLEKITVRGVRKPGALKVLALFPGVMKKFFLGSVYENYYRNEERALRCLNGCDAPKLISSSFQNGMGMIECERIEGIALNQIKKENVKLTDLQNALQKLFANLHNQAICHGDISAENIIHTPSGDLKLIDFEASSMLLGDACIDTKNIKQLFDQLGRWYADCAT